MGVERLLALGFCLELIQNSRSFQVEALVIASVVQYQKCSHVRCQACNHVRRPSLEVQSRPSSRFKSAALLAELSRREKQAGIFTEAEIDLFLKATTMEGMENRLQTDYTLKVLGEDICGDTIVSGDMQRGISGGEKKRVTTGMPLNHIGDSS